MTIRERVRSVGLALAVVACGAAAALVFRPEPASPEAEAAIALPKSKVSFRLVDTSTGKETTAMVCLTRLDDETIRLPPDGRVMKKVGRTDEFYRGLEYDKSKTDWVGPVRGVGAATRRRPWRRRHLLGTWRYFAGGAAYSAGGIHSDTNMTSYLFWTDKYATDIYDIYYI